MRLLYYYILCMITLLGFAACNNEEENHQVLEIEDPTTEISELISNLGHYDVGLIEELLTEKHWIEDAHIEYTENWEEIKTIYIGLGNIPAPGATHSHYIFHPDGKLEDFTDVEHTPEEEYQVRTWAFNLENRTLTIDGTLNYHLIALGEDTFVWDYIDTWSSYHPRYFRDVFKTKAIE